MLEFRPPGARGSHYNENGKGASAFICTRCKINVFWVLTIATRFATNVIVSSQQYMSQPAPHSDRLKRDGYGSNNQTRFASSVACRDHAARHCACEAQLRRV